jgi:uncharacterized protein YkwD
VGPLTAACLRAFAISCLLLLLALATAGRAAAASSCAGSQVVPTQTNLAQVRHATLCLLNVERRRRGLRPLRENRSLAAAARYHSRDMVARRYFAHTSPSGDTVSSRIKRTGYMAGRPCTVGENLAWGTGPMSTPASIMDGWMHSPEHRGNILYPRFRQIGIYIDPAVPVALPGNIEGGTFATDFGVRL